MYRVILHQSGLDISTFTVEGGSGDKGYTSSSVLCSPLLCLGLTLVVPVCFQVVTWVTASINLLSDQGYKLEGSFAFKYSLVYFFMKRNMIRDEAWYSQDFLFVLESPRLRCSDYLHWIELFTHVLGLGGVRCDYLVLCHVLLFHVREVVKVEKSVENQHISTLTSNDTCAYVKHVKKHSHLP